jgi:hypothetical protein
MVHSSFCLRISAPTKLRELFGGLPIGTGPLGFLEASASIAGVNSPPKYFSSVGAMIRVAHEARR